ERVPAVIYIDTDEPSPRTVYISPNVEAVMGYSPARYLEAGDLWTGLVHPDDRARVLDAWAVSIERGDTFDMEYRANRADGGEIWVHDHAVLSRDDQEDRVHWQGVLVDITDRVHAERELATSES